MKRSGHRRARLGVLVALSAASGLILPAGALAKKTAAQTKSPLAGAWMATVTFATNAPTSGAETALQGFGSDGLLSEYASADRTTGYGVWKATGARSFKYTFRELLFNTDNALEGFVVVKQAGTVSANGLSYTSTGEGQVFSLTGAPLSPPARSTTHATRITSWHTTVNRPSAIPDGLL
jgi:hypothetical protein